jgi:uncharacterized protein YggU (UPF0235/DUF167 family)
MYIKVRVISNQKKEKIEEVKDNSLKIWVKEKALRNMANIRVLELVADHFKVKKEKIRIINGHHSPSKLLSIQD